MEIHRRYVTMKLSTGEDVIGVISDEDPEGFLVSHPMHIQSETDMDHHVEQYWAQPLCPFTDEQTYFIAKRNLVWIKPLSKYLVPFYHNMVQHFGESEIIKNARMRVQGKVNWGGQEISEEEARARVDQIKKARSFAELDDEDTTVH